MDFSVLMTVAVPVLPCTTLSQRAMPATLLSNPVVCRILGGRTVFSFQFCGGCIFAPLLDNPPKRSKKRQMFLKILYFVLLSPSQTLFRTEFSFHSLSSLTLLMGKIFGGWGDWRENIFSVSLSCFQNHASHLSIAVSKNLSLALWRNKKAPHKIELRQ